MFMNHYAPGVPAVNGPTLTLGHDIFQGQAQEKAAKEHEAKAEEDKEESEE